MTFYLLAGGSCPNPLQLDREAPMSVRLNIHSLFVIFALFQIAMSRFMLKLLQVLEVIIGKSRRVSLELSSITTSMRKNRQCKIRDPNNSLIVFVVIR